MPTRLTEAAVVMLVLPLYVVGAHLYRFATGKAFEPLIVVATLYIVVSGLLAWHLTKRSRTAWVIGVAFTVIGSCISAYSGWKFVVFLISGRIVAVTAVAALAVFHGVFLLSFAVALGLLLTRRARSELRGA